MNNNKPTISIVMSVFNGERYLALAMESILNQTYGDYEFIIVNDGSSDKTEQIIKQYDDQRIHYIYQDNAGLPVALNKGIAAASGEYIVRMDADDISLPDRLEYQVKFMQDHPEIDLMGGQVYLIDENGHPAGVKLKPTDSNIVSSALEFACTINHPTYIVKKALYDELGGYREQFIYAQDYDFLLRAKDMGATLANTENFLMNYRVLNTSVNVAKDYYQMFLSRHILALHRQRVRTGRESEKTLKKLSQPRPMPSNWFTLIYSVRLSLMVNAKDKNKIGKLLTMTLVALISVLHIELLISSVRGVLYKGAKRGYFS